jgi:hypothetical protein
MPDIAGPLKILYCVIPEPPIINGIVATVSSQGTRIGFCVIVMDGGFGK